MTTYTPEVSNPGAMGSISPLSISTKLEVEENPGL
jgi:hypothetical protein